MSAIPGWISYACAILFLVASGRMACAVDAALNPILDVAFSPDGKLLAAGSGSEKFSGMITTGAGGGAVRIWSVGGWTQRALLLDGFSGSARCVAFSPDGATLAAGTDQYELKKPGNPFRGSRVRFWDIGKLKELGSLDLH
jgi:WD40 repeat protein